MENRNGFLRQAAKEAGVPLWRVAEAMDVSEPTITRLLRKKHLSEKERTAFMSAIRKAAEEDAVSREEDNE